MIPYLLVLYFVFHIMITFVIKTVVGRSKYVLQHNYSPGVVRVSWSSICLEALPLLHLGNHHICHLLWEAFPDCYPEMCVTRE